MQIVFKSLPGLNISRLELGKSKSIICALDKSIHVKLWQLCVHVCIDILVSSFHWFSDAGRERIYVAAETEVKGFSKKGKQFLSFDTNVTEPIQSM